MKPRKVAKILSQLLGGTTMSQHKIVSTLAIRKGLERVGLTEKYQVCNSYSKYFLNNPSFQRQTLPLYKPKISSSQTLIQTTSVEKEIITES